MIDEPGSTVRRVRSRRHHIGRAALCVGLGLALGAVTSVGAAWAVAIYHSCFHVAMSAAPGTLIENRRAWKVATWGGVGMSAYFLQTHELSTAASLDRAWAKLAQESADPAVRGRAKRDFESRLKDYDREVSYRLTFGPPREVPEWVSRPERDSGFSMAETTATGWPARCLAGESRTGWEDGIIMEHRRIWIVHPPQWISTSPLTLPLRPLWTGMVVNTTFYGALWTGLFIGRPALRRWRRKRRGLCPGCGYPVGISTVCTECGGPVRPRLKGSA